MFVIGSFHCKPLMETFVTSSNVKLVYPQPLDRQDPSTFERMNN